MSRGPRKGVTGLLHDGCNRFITRSNSGVGTHMENSQCRRLHAKPMETPSTSQRKRTKQPNSKDKPTKQAFHFFLHSLWYGGHTYHVPGEVPDIYAEQKLVLLDSRYPDYTAVRKRRRRYNRATATISQHVPPLCRKLADIVSIPSERHPDAERHRRVNSVVSALCG